MFPFKTDTFNFNSSLTETQIQKILDSKINKVKWYEIYYNYESYCGIVKSNQAAFRDGCQAKKNAFTPTIIFTWRQTTVGCIVSGHLRMSYLILLVFLLIPISGIYNTIVNNSATPLIACLIVYIVLQFCLFFPVYNYSKSKVIDDLEKLKDKIK